LGVVVFYVPFIFLVSLLDPHASLSYVHHLASITCKFVYSAFVGSLYVTSLFLFQKLLSCVGGFDRYSYVGLFKKICDLFLGCNI
jgi:hypothetical protein